MTDDLLGDLLRDLMGARVLDIGSEFQVTKAKDAFALVQNYAADARELPVRNELGMFPRIKVMDHRDLELLRVLVANHAAELKENLIESAGRFALGSEHVHLGDLHNMGAEYVQAVQLVRALEKEHDTKLEYEQQAAKAEQQAQEAFAALKAFRESESNTAQQMQNRDTGL